MKKIKKSTLEQIIETFISKPKKRITESSNEAKGIASLTGTRADAVQKFIDDFNLNARKLLTYLSKNGLKQKMDFMTALSGKPGNKYQGEFVGMFAESKLNEAVMHKFELLGYDTPSDRVESFDEDVAVSNMKDLIKIATNLAKKQDAYKLEIFYKNLYIGSLHKKYGYKFQKEMDYEDNPLAESKLNETSGDFAGWIAGFNGKKIEIKKDEANGIYGAKQLAIKKLNVPKSKESLLWIKPAVEESVNEDVLTEGVNDPNILKAVLLAGGPGSGKSWIVNNIFGVPPKLATRFTASGLKVVNSDMAFEHELKKMGVDMKTLGSIPDEEWNKLTADTNSPRATAKDRTAKMQKYYTDGRLGLIIDGTGDDFAKIKEKKDSLEALGYDVYMLFVNTDLDTALVRNRQRDRVLKDDLVINIWKNVQNNMGKFQQLFKSNMRIIDNTEPIKYDPNSEDPRERSLSFKFQEINKPIVTAIDKFIKLPLKNPIGKQWIEKAREAAKL